jgi:hypothetical protein
MFRRRICIGTVEEWMFLDGNFAPDADFGFAVVVDAFLKGCRERREVDVRDGRHVFGEGVLSWGKVCSLVRGLVDGMVFWGMRGFTGQIYISAVAFCLLLLVSRRVQAVLSQSRLNCRGTILTRSCTVSSWIVFANNQ